MLHYPAAQCSNLTQALAQFHKLKEEQILAGGGSTEFIYALTRVLKLKRVLIVTPTFSEYENALECLNIWPELSIHYFDIREVIREFCQKKEPWIVNALAQIAGEESLLRMKVTSLGRESLSARGII